MEQDRVIGKLEEHDNRFDTIDHWIVRADAGFDAIDNKLEEVDKRFEAVDRRFDEVDKRFEAVDRRFDEVDKHFEAVDKKLADHDDKFDILVGKLLDHDQEFVLVRREIAELRHDMMSGQDEMLTILRRLDTESASTISGVRRVENRCDQNTRDITRHESEISDIKRHTGMV